MKKDRLLIIPLTSAIIALTLTATYSSSVYANSNYNNSQQSNVQGRLNHQASSYLGLSDRKQSNAFNAGNVILSSKANELLSMINQERVKAGLKPLNADTVLVRIANAKVRDMSRFNYFGHRSENLGTIFDQLTDEHRSYQLAAENLVANHDYHEANRKTFRSPAHRLNLMNPAFKKIGIAILPNDKLGWMIVEIFTD